MTIDQWRSRLENLKGRPDHDRTVDSELAALTCELEQAVGRLSGIAIDAAASRKAELILESMALSNSDAISQDLPAGAEVFAARIIGPRLKADIDQWISEQNIDVNAVAVEREALDREMAFAHRHFEVLSAYRNLLDLLM